MAAREELIFLMSTWLRINVPFLNFPTWPTRPLDRMLGAAFFFLGFLRGEREGFRVKLRGSPGHWPDHVVLPLSPALHVFPGPSDPPAA